MDFETTPQNLTTENLQSFEPDIKDLCIDVSYTCNHYSKKLDTMKMSKEIYDVYAFHMNILDATNEFWQLLLSIVIQKNKFDAENFCFSIMNLKNCDSLNKFYHSFNIESIQYMKNYIGPQSHDDYLGLVKKLFTSFDFFLQLTLPSLENNIKSLLIVIIMPNGDGSLTRDYYKKPYVGSIVNIMIEKYLEKLQEFFSGFKLVNPSKELIEKKILIESRIKKSIEINVEILKLPKPEDAFTSSSTTKEPAGISTSTLPPFSSIITPTITSSTEINLPTSSLITETTTAVFKNSTTKKYHPSNATYEDYVTKPTFKISENYDFINKTDNLKNIKANFDEINRLSKNDTSDQSSTVNLTSNMGWVIFGSVFLLISLIFVIAFVLKKYILNRYKLRINDRSVRLNNKKANSVAF